LKIRFLLIYLFILASSFNAFSTHIVGGEMNYECLGNNQYRIRLKLYRDCYLGQAPFDDPVHLTIFNGSGSLLSFEQIFFPGSTIVPGNVNNPCYTPPSDICVEEAIYEKIITLPPSNTGHIISYQRCCRNNSILNITNPWDAGATYTAFIPPNNVVSCNSNPVFNEFPPIFLCAGAPLVFDHSATDIDGDSLVYEICDPFEGASPNDPMPTQSSPPPFNYVNFVPPYSSAYPMSSSPALSVNPQTGLLTGVPNMVGQWVIGICVKEYRNGVLLSENKRDFQFNVLNCPGLVVASVPSQQVFCDGFTVNFNNTSFNAFGYFWDFGYPGATSTLPNPSHTFPDTGVYVVTLVANPNTICADTAQTTFRIYPPLNPNFTIPAAQCFSGHSYDFQAQGNYTNNASIRWDFGVNSNPSTSLLENPNNILFNTSGNQIVSLEISDHGCTEVFITNVMVLPDPIADIGPQVDFCIGYTVDFVNLSQHSNNYLWFFGENNLTSNLFEPSHTYGDTGLFNIMMVADNGVCADTTFESFTVFPLLKPEIFGDTTSCLNGHNFNFIAAGSKTNYATYEWNIPNGSTVFSTDSFMYNITFDTVGVYPVSLTISENGCSKTKTINVYIANAPIADFLGAPLQGCRPLKVQFTDQSFTETNLDYQWNFGNGDFSNLQNPSTTYTTAGFFDVTLTVTSTEICFETSSITKPQYVNVFELPTSIFSASPKIVSIFEPIVEVNDQSIGNTNCTYFFGNGETTTNCDYIQQYSDTGYFTITQIVVDEKGCRDTSTQIIYVSPEYRFFIPNTFTPNTDSKNDVFKPVMTGVKEYEFFIFNRWGEIVFKTNDTSEGWNGNGKYDNPAPQGVYLYKIKLKNDFNKIELFQGHVNLIR